MSSVSTCILCQIASLKAVIARKDGELEHFRQSANGIAEITRLKSQFSSLIPNNWTSGGRKLPRDDFSSIEVTY